MKKKNGFDKFDIILCIVCMLILYIVIYWFTNFGDVIMEAKNSTVQSEEVIDTEKVAE